jgi:hypothetical protein
MNQYWLNEYFPNAIAAASRQMPDINIVLHELGRAGFFIVGVETFLVQPDLQDLFLYSGKYEPGLYLNERIRAGISTFANLASKEEIDWGCSKLQNDIISGRIGRVIERFPSQFGDYLFIVAEKRTDL